MRNAPNDLPVPDETQRRGQLVLRALPILLIPVFVGILVGVILRTTEATPVPPEFEGDTRSLTLLLRIAPLVIFFAALIILVRLGRPTVSALLVIGAWTLVTTLASLHFGVATVWPALLLMPICAAGLLIDWAASVSLAALGTLLVLTIGLLEMEGLPFPAAPVPAFVAQNAPIISAGYWIGLFWAVAALTSLLSRGLQRALDQSRAHAAALSQLSAQLEARVAEQTAELGRRAARAEALYEVSRALTSTRDLAQVLALICEQAAHLLHFESALVVVSVAGEAPAVMAAYRPPDALVRSPHCCREALQGAAAQGAPAVVSLRIDGEPERRALSLPMRYGSDVQGALLMLDGAGLPERSGADLALGVGLADQAAVAIASAHLLEQSLEQSREAAMLEERTRLARDIHDTLAQGLTGIVVQLGAAQRALAAAPREVSAGAGEHLDLARRMARESLSEARRSVWNLRAPALERGDLSDALQGLADHPLRPETAVSFERRGQPRPLPPSVESALLRVCQEALANVAKHAQATRAQIVLDYLPDGVQLGVSDNGAGFDESILADGVAVPGPWGGFGLLGMRERLAQLGGTLELSSEGGARVVARVRVEG